MSCNHVMLSALFAACTHAATIQGTIIDPTGAVLPRATVSATNAATRVHRTTVSDGNGLYQFMDLDQGAYIVTATAPGFRQLTHPVTLTAQATLDFELAVAAEIDFDYVYAKPPLDGTTDITIAKRVVVALPLDGRNFVPLLALSPGVSLPPGSTLPRINGSRPRTSEYIYDGISVLQPEPGQVPFYPIIDATDEIYVETNSYNAEYGRSNGGVIQVRHRAGSNDFHGTLFQFFRNERLNARNLFATTGAKPRFRRNQYGFTFGGPIARNRTFFFLDWQGTRLSTGAVKTSTVPTGTRIATDPVAQALLARFPAPTSTRSANNFTRIADDNTAQDQADIRIDRGQFFVHYTVSRDHASVAQFLPDPNATTDTRAHALAISHTQTLRPMLSNEVRFGFTRRSADRDALRSPIYDIAGYRQLGAPAGSIGRSDTSVTQFLDHLTSIRGTHTIKAGLDVRHQRLNAHAPSLPYGRYQFTSAFGSDSLTSFLKGHVARYDIDVQPEPLRPRATIAEAFIQDQWSLHPRFRINAGLRYTLNFPSTVVDDRGAVFNLDTQQLDYLGRDGHSRSARNLEKTNFGPRLGLAYELAPDVVLSSGYGLTWFEQSGITTPFTTPFFPFIQTLTQQARDNLTPAFQLSAGPTVQASALGQNVFAAQRDNGSGYAQQWNLSLRKLWRKAWNIEVGYLGSKLTRLGVPDVNLNQMMGGSRPYPNFNNVALYRNNVGHSTYHSLQARFERRYANKLSLNLAYTFSKLIDDAGAVFDSATLSAPPAAFNVADSHNRKLEKDASTGHIPHIVSADVVYDLPWGIQLAAIARAQSGSPLAVTQATNFNAFAGYGVQRPNRVANPAGPRTTARWFNTAAFTLAPAGTLGSSSRNPVIGPGYRALDIMIGKTVALTDHVKLELRAEAFNATNTPALGAPNTSFGSPGFGSITTAGDPRAFELVGKVHF